MTAYEMRISDWSSDVCSSDLYSARRPAPGSVRRPAFIVDVDECRATRQPRSGIEQGIELALQLAHRARQLAVAAFGLFAQLLQFVGAVQRGQHRDPVARGPAVGAAHLAHSRDAQLGARKSAASGKNG